MKERPDVNRGDAWHRVRGALTTGKRGGNEFRVKLTRLFVFMNVCLSQVII